MTADLLREENINLGLDEFIEEIKDVLQQELDGEYEIYLKEVTKNNSSIKKGLVLKNHDSNLAPTVYMEDFYKQYICGEKIENLAHSVMSVLLTHSTKKNFDISFFEDFSKIKDNIFCKLISKEKNEALLDNVPYVDFLDMAIVFYYMLDNTKEDFLKNDTDITASILIYNNHLELWNVDKKAVYECASYNTPLSFRATLDDMEVVIREMIINKIKDNNEDMSDEEISEEYNNSPLCKDIGSMRGKMYVLSNESRRYGATSLLYEDVLQGFANMIEGDFYILPSSIHEVILVPHNSAYDVSDLYSMVKDVNEKEVPNEDILSDNVYYYDYTNKELRQA